jgi:integrase
MASVVRIGKRWRALVRRKGYPPACKTFATKAQATTWARGVEANIDAGRPLAAVAALGVGELIQTYRELREASRPILDTANEHYMLEHLDAGLGELPSLSIKDLVGYCKMRRAEGAGPYTVNMEISKLGTVLRYAASALELQLQLADVVGHARPLLTHLKLIGGGGQRERRAGEDELTRICEALSPQIADVVRFAVASCMRRGEIVRIRWVDVNVAMRCVLIRDRKDPRNKLGNDQLVPLLGEAWDIANRQPRESDAIFPYHEQTITKAFTGACKRLSIPDLHFHDLRHEGTSRLFEQGYTIEQVALVTGHRDWRHLRRYTNLRPEDLHKARRAVREFPP